MTIRVVLVDDQPMMRAGLSMLLGAENDIEVVAEAADGEAGLIAVEQHRPDVVVLDVKMPRLDGVETTRRLLEQADTSHPAPAVLILTTYQADDMVYAALQAGASGFLLKDAAPAELASAVRAVADGLGWLAPAVARTVITQLARSPVASREVTSSVDRLTPAERKVFLLIAEGLSNKEIADRLVVGEGTVKTHVSHALMKLGLRDRAQAVAFAFRSGLMDN